LPTAIVSRHLRDHLPDITIIIRNYIYNVCICIYIYTYLVYKILSPSIFPSHQPDGDSVRPNVLPVCAVPIWNSSGMRPKAAASAVGGTQRRTQVSPRNGWCNFNHDYFCGCPNFQPYASQ
jgi:hypothetical protein